MHIAEGVLPGTQCLAWFGVSAPFLAASGHRMARLRDDDSNARRGVLAMAGAIVMAVTVLPVPIPGLGVSSHMCATPVLALLLGPRIMAIPTALVLVIQALFLAHGGLTSLGANVFTLGVVGPFAGFALARMGRAAGLPRDASVGIACGLADVLVYVVDAAIVAGGLHGEHSFGWWFSTILLAFAPAQLPLALLEGVLSACLVRALAGRRADLVPLWLSPGGTAARMKTASATAALVFVALLLGGGRTARADGWKGLDDIVREKARTVTGGGRDLSLVTDGGEVFIFCVAVTFFTSGLVLGRGWARLGDRREAADAPGP